jgi:hypothetical protein
MVKNKKIKKFNLLLNNYFFFLFTKYFPLIKLFSKTKLKEYISLLKDCKQPG